ncbi:MAG: NAD(P)H-binding protein [Kineosporiaceae bacterium]|nr:NAD(P)H-binding protein [Aeromicrobium sp.]
MIVITAPTGQIGRHVVQELLATDAPLRVVVRDASKLPDEVRDRVEVVEGSHGDAVVIDRALNGADALFWLAPMDATRTLDEVYLDFTRPAAEAIRRCGVARIVSVTALGRGTRWEDRAGLVTASIQMDDMLMATGAAFRGLAMPSFMDNILRQAASIRDKGLMFGPVDAVRKAPTTCTRDMGMVAAELLADGSWTGQQEVPVLGPEDLSMNDMAAIASDVLGREVRYVRTSYEDLKQQFLVYGASESFAQGYVDMFRAKDEGMDNIAERDATIHTQTSFRQWCEEELKSAVVG